MASPVDAITHVVLVQVKPDISAVERRSAFEEFYALKNKCLNAEGKPYIKSILGGKDNSPEGLQDGITHVFIVEFEKSADRDYYVKDDAAHKAFVETLKGAVVKVQVVDFTPYRL
ncbi:unnamed protein product [Clonostachys solani]|uniref:Stress-response A/B barrel domain-containing protein n=1 Tax=Clonostachys solani TaxID=160281 RepID=A0A9N9VZQ8_9HYPO|nr:unnamed protein product [Clonostachys solani]